MGQVWGEIKLRARWAKEYDDLRTADSTIGVGLARAVHVAQVAQDLLWAFQDKLKK